MSNTLSASTPSTLFEAGTFGYHTYRIPAVVSLGHGVIVVATEARRDGLRDWGQIDIVVRRSLDAGKSFDAQRVVVTKPGFTSGNPTWVFDAATNVLALLFCRNVADQHEALVFEGKATRTVWMCVSHDGGVSFSTPHEITAEVKPADWTWYATGPGHGLVLTNGRWVVPCCHAVAITSSHDDPVHSHVIVSDDRGETWRLGGTVEVPRSSECGLAEVQPNEIYLDFRHDAEPRTRGGAYSFDAGASFAWHTLHDTVPDPGCRGGVTGGTARGDAWLSHVTGPKRQNLVLECSRDGGRTFERVFCVAPGLVAYSDLVLVGDTLMCAFETGESNAYERIDWVLCEQKISAGLG
jgi:sialidase-1